MYVDTSPAAIDQRVQATMRVKHIEQLTAHEYRFGKLGQLQSKNQRKALKRVLQLDQA